MGTFGPHYLLDMVAKVANAAIKASWYHKWVVHRRVRPEEFGGRVYLHKAGIAESPIHADLLSISGVLDAVSARYGSSLLPLAYPEGCPLHPSYPGAHPTITGACVTILKAYFGILDSGKQPILFKELKERGTPYGPKAPIQSYNTGVGMQGSGTLTPLPAAVAYQLTIEG